jgi:hypothetical protein
MFEINRPCTLSEWNPGDAKFFLYSRTQRSGRRQRKTPGYLQLILSQWQQTDHGHLEPITWESQRYSILKGCYVTPYARSIFRDHVALVAGLLIDPTWRIIRLYVASILTVVLGNVGIPIALSFGPVEDAGLCNTFYPTLRELFDFD